MVYLAEVHGFYTFATQCWAEGRRRRRLAGADNQFDDLVVCESFARHFVLLLWVYDNLPPSHATPRRKFQTPQLPKAGSGVNGHVIQL